MCLIVCDVEISTMRRSMPELDCCAVGIKSTNISISDKIYLFFSKSPDLLRCPPNFVLMGTGAFCPWAGT